jgi:hypothetical protein
MGTAEALIRTIAEPLGPDQIEWLTDRDIDVDWSVLPDHQIMLAGRLTGLSLERVAAMLGATDRDARRRLGDEALLAVRDADGPRLVDVGNDSLTIAGITDGTSPALVWARGGRGPHRAGGRRARPDGLHRRAACGVRPRGRLDPQPHGRRREEAAARRL